MNEEQIRNIVQEQKNFFAQGKTLSIAYRKNALRMLGKAIDVFENRIIEALKADLGKSPTESYMCEISLVKSEIAYMLRHVAHFARQKRVHTPLSQSVARSYEQPSPYGTVLIMSPWNYPFLLTIDPLVDALAAGNTAVLKPSAYAPHTAQVISEMIHSYFPPRYVAVVLGGREENQYLLDEPFSYIFFTGSKAVGKEVMAHGAKRLIPVTLELGGKSPCIVDETANLRVAARRIVFGKFINCGQTCVAPDYIYCHESIKERLIGELKKQIILQYGAHPLKNKAYGKIINEKHFLRLQGLMQGQSVAFGGGTNPSAHRIEPTILDKATWDDPVMKEEIFGPLLPVLSYKSLTDVVKKLQGEASPLALYIFSSDKEAIRYVTQRVSFGGGCVNDTLIHLATNAMGFGGVGESGMGSYHGRYGFETFTHRKSIVDKKTFLDLSLRYQPYTQWKNRMIRMFMK